MIWAIASAVISAVAGIVYREWINRRHSKRQDARIAELEAEKQALLERIQEHGKMAANTPVHDPDNIQL